jgi:hypothetical protein
MKKIIKKKFSRQLTDEPICNVENCGTIPYGTAAESLLIIIETPRG